MARNQKAAREAGRKALEDIVDETVMWALEMHKDGGYVGEPIQLAMDASGERLAANLGHGFDRDLLDAWETNAARSVRTLAFEQVAVPCNLGAALRYVGTASLHDAGGAIWKTVSYSL